MKKEKSHSDQAIELANKRAYARKYYQAHKSEARAYYILNRRKIKFRAAAWRVVNRVRYLEQQAEYDRTQRPYRILNKSLDKLWNNLERPSNLLK